MNNRGKISQIKTSGKKISKLLLKLGIREGYLLSRNLFGLVEHPKMTIARIINQRDLSQGILIFGLPIGLWFGWIVILLLSRIFIFGKLQFGFLAKASFLGSTVFVFFVLCLFSFLVFKVLRNQRREK